MTVYQRKEINPLRALAHTHNNNNTNNNNVLGVQFVRKTKSRTGAATGSCSLHGGRRARKQKMRVDLVAIGPSLNYGTLERRCLRFQRLSIYYDFLGA